MFRYDEEALYFDADVRSIKRQELVQMVYSIIKPVFEYQVKHLIQEIRDQFCHQLQVGISVDKKDFSDCASECRSNSLLKFQECFTSIEVQGTGWLATVYQPELETELENHVRHLMNEKVWVLCIQGVYEWDNHFYCYFGERLENWHRTYYGDAH